MTIQPYEPHAPSLYTPPADEEWASLARQCDVLAKSGLMPRALNGKAMAVFAVVLKGRELGMTPLTSIAELHIIDGKVGMSAQAMRAKVVQAHHDIWMSEGSNESVTMMAVRCDRPERVESETFTMADARQAGVAHKDNWKHYPKAMLTARATAMLCRRVFMDVLLGCAYLPDEIGTDAVDLGAVTGPEPAVVLDDIEHTHDGAAHSHPGGNLLHSHDEPAPKRTALAEGYDPLADLRLMVEQGIDDWSVYAGAVVRKRTKVQMGADRLMAALESGDPRVVDPRVRDFDGPVVDGVVVPPAPVPSVEEPCSVCGVTTTSDRNPCAACDSPTPPAGGEPRPTSEEASAALGGEPITGDGEADPTADAIPTPSHDEAGDPVLPADDQGVIPRSVGVVLADIADAGKVLGKSSGQLLIRWASVARKAPEAATAEDVPSLEAVLAQLMPEVEKRVQSLAEGEQS